MRHLREPQELGLSFMHSRKRCNLYMPMGFGKTATALTYIAEADLDAPWLVLGPLRVARKTWSDEVQEWDHLRHLKVATITGAAGERAEALRQRAHLHTLNYENAPWLLEQLPADRWPFKGVIADESLRLKSFRSSQGGVRAAALAQIAHRCERWVNLCGHPISAGLMDLWGPQWFVDEGAALGDSYSQFLNRWFYKEAGKGDRRFARMLPFRHSQAEIEALMKPTTLAMRVEDYFQLDEPIVFDVRAEMPPEAKREYRRMARELYAKLRDGTIVNAFAAAGKSIKLLQLASGAVYTDDGKSWGVMHDEKIEALQSIVNETGGEPLLVSYEFRHELARILKAFPQARELRTKKDENDWNKGLIPMLVTHPQSAGHGLSLQHGGHILVYFGHTWQQEASAQILERIGPMRQMQSGYKRPVIVYRIITSDTADEAVIAVNEHRANVMDALMGHLSQC